MTTNRPCVALGKYRVEPLELFIVEPRIVAGDVSHAERRIETGYAPVRTLNQEISTRLLQHVQREIEAGASIVEIVIADQRKQPHARPGEP